jgi:hypothetical protein
MAPVEWPISASSPDEQSAAALGAEGDRLACVRADFFLSPDQRLTEQERALMTAMLADLVTTVADEIRAAASIADTRGEGPTELFDQLRSGGQLNIPEVIAVLLRRAEEERIAAVLRASTGSAKSRFLNSLAGDADSDVAAAAMALVLGRSRRRDRYGNPRVQLDDVAAEGAVRLTYSVAAAVALQGASDRLAGEGAAEVLSQHDEGKRIEALTFALVHALDEARRLNEAILLAAAADGEVAFLVEALARRAGTDFATAWGHLRGAGKFALLLRMAGASRQFAAELAACFGDLLSGGAAMEVERFDTLDEGQVERTRKWLRLDPHYRAALSALGGHDG